MVKYNDIPKKQKAFKYKQITMVFALIIFTLISIFPSTELHAKANNKYAAFIMDADTGLILHQDNANKRLHPASLTKMMTLIMIFDALDSGKINLHTRIKVSKYAASMIPSKIGLEAGKTIRVRDAINAIAIKSANDIAVAVAEKLGKSERNFARMMTKKARGFGMKRTYFMNASGLHHPKQVSSARDMARLGRIIVTKYKKYYHYFSKKSFTYQGKTYNSHNKLMSTYAGMDGLKTGYINKSGFNLVSSATRNNRRLIGVVFGGKTGKSRNAKMEELLDNAFSRLGTYRVALNNVPKPQKKPMPPKYRISLYKFPPPPPPSNSSSNSSSPKIMPKEKSTKYSMINIKRWAMLGSADDNSMLNRMIGQGDYDINVRNRIETGLIAISSHLGEKIPTYIFDKSPSNQMKMANIPRKPVIEKGSWAVQVGAFTTRKSSNDAISKSMKKLPKYLRHEQSAVAPLQTSKGWVFRARLHGYTKQSAKDACKILRDCVTIAPHT